MEEKLAKILGPPSFPQSYIALRFAILYVVFSTASLTELLTPSWLRASTPNSCSPIFPLGAPFPRSAPSPQRTLDVCCLDVRPRQRLGVSVCSLNRPPWLVTITTSPKENGLGSILKNPRGADGDDWSFPRESIID